MYCREEKQTGWVNSCAIVSDSAPCKQFARLGIAEPTEKRTRAPLTNSWQTGRVGDDAGRLRITFADPHREEALSSYPLLHHPRKDQFQQLVLLTACCRQVTSRVYIIV